jgi:ubiquitin carboxyl-terminal hydrolase 25/28
MDDRWTASGPGLLPSSAPPPSRFLLAILSQPDIMLIRTAPTGKTAPRLINDLLDHDPRYSTNHGRNLLVDPAPRFKGPGSLPARKAKLDCRHILMKKDHQTNAPRSNDEQPDESTEYKVAAYCSACLYHFDVTPNFWKRKERKTPCKLSDDSSPLHHLRLVESRTSREHRENGGLTKYEPLTEAHRFVCSGMECPLVVDIKISPPRLSHHMLSYILDAAKLDARGRREINNDPERYQGMPPIKPLQALGYLRQYLVDAKGAKNRTELKKIARRNKKYMLTFADECDELFKYLDFVPVEEASLEPEVSLQNLIYYQFPGLVDRSQILVSKPLY